ncbi:MAG: Uma2 family endonuclease [Clostridiales bacterium]|jgi:Uma2 family endonuclease|nr:Uma2 family endonuclease [Clostridiales bacterium]
MQLQQEKGHFTYEDYYAWDNEPRCELIDGEIYFMAMPTVSHQRISGRLLRRFGEHLDGKKCEVFPPLDVRLNWERGDDTVVQPDLLVICDPEKIADGKSVKGAPDLVIEILSPSTAGYDTTKKLAKYCKAGVREIWFAGPEAGTMLVYKRNDSGGYIIDFYHRDDKITVGILPDFTIDMKDIFETEEGEIS